MINKRIFLTLLPMLFSLCGCANQTEIVCSKIKVNGNEFTLRNPFYKLKGKDVIFADVSEASSYLGGSADYSQDYKEVWVGFSGFVVMFTKDNNIATKAIIQSQQFLDYTISSPVRGKNNGLDVPIDDYVDKILGFQHTIKNGTYIVTK